MKEYKKKIVDEFDLENIMENFEPNQKIKFEIFRNSKKK